MENQRIYIGNRLIVEFMGYTFYHKGVDVDWSDVGGMYERKEIFSKVPILVDEYPSEDQYYFSEIANPDFRNHNNPKWRNDREKLCWGTINGGNYLTDLDYHSNWNSLMPVCKKIIEMYFDMRSEIFDGLTSCDINKTHIAVVEFIKFWNDDSQQKIKFNTTNNVG